MIMREKIMHKKRSGCSKSIAKKTGDMDKRMRVNPIAMPKPSLLLVLMLFFHVMAQGARGNSNSSPYKILGVNKNANQDEIRKVYRKLCLKYHPDKNVNLPKHDRVRCENKFKAIQDANSLIGTSESRKTYDNSRQLHDNLQNSMSSSYSDPFKSNAYNPYKNQNPFAQGARRYRQFPQRRRFYVNGIDISHLFNNANSYSDSRRGSPLGAFFQNMNSFNTNENDVDNTNSYSSQQPKSIFIQKVTVSLEELYGGVQTKEFQFRDNFLQTYRAAFRGGIAAQIVLQGLMTSAPLLLRTSWPVSLSVFFLTCHMSLPRPTKLFYFTKIKRGWKAGTKLIFQQEPGIDVVFVIDEKKHDRFVRVGNDLKTTAIISRMKAKQGCKILIDPLGQNELPIMVKLNKGDLAKGEDQHVVEVRGRGWPKSDGSRGNLYVTIKVVSDSKAKMKSKTRVSK